MTTESVRGQSADVSAPRRTQTETETQTNYRSSRSDHLRPVLEGLREEVSLTRLVLSLRPDWDADATLRALTADDRPWRTVVLASIRGAAGTEVRHPNGLRYVNPDGVTTTQLPPSLAEYRNAPRCDDHGAIAGSCALCRHGIGDVS